jgi:hypothetical protein
VPVPEPDPVPVPEPQEPQPEQNPSIYWDIGDDTDQVFGLPNTIFDLR